MAAWRRRLLKSLDSFWRVPNHTGLDTAGRYAFPPCLLIYQDSRYFASMISLSKLAAIIPSLWVTWNLSLPAFNDGNTAEAINRTVISLLPIPLISALNGSYVASIFLFLPVQARTSPQALQRWLKKIPMTTRLQFQTVGWTGAPTVHTHMLDSLRPIPHKMFRLAQYSTVKARHRTFAIGQHFFVRRPGAGSPDIKVQGIWPELSRMIKKQGNW